MIPGRPDSDFINASFIQVEHIMIFLLTKILI
jgi:hypothetical protein